MYVGQKTEGSDRGLGGGHKQTQVCRRVRNRPSEVAALGGQLEAGIAEDFLLMSELVTSVDYVPHSKKSVSESSESWAGVWHSS